MSNWICRNLGHKFRTTTVLGVPDINVVRGLKCSEFMARQILEDSRPVVSTQTYCTRCGDPKPEEGGS